MKVISGKIFTVKVAIPRLQEDGLVKKVKEEYAVKAVSFTDCEARITEEVGSADNVAEDFEVLSESVAPFNEVFVYDEGDIFYKVKSVSTETSDSGKEVKTAFYYLVNAPDIEQARKNIDAALYGVEHTIVAVVEQRILDVFD